MLAATWPSAPPADTSPIPCAALPFFGCGLRIRTPPCGTALINTCRCTCRPQVYRSEPPSECIEACFGDYRCHGFVTYQGSCYYRGATPDRLMQLRSPSSGSVLYILHGQHSVPPAPAPALSPAPPPARPSPSPPPPAPPLPPRLPLERLLAGPLLDMMDAVDTEAISRDASKLASQLAVDTAAISQDVSQLASSFAERFTSLFAQLFAAPSYVWVALAAAVVAFVAWMAGACGSMQARLAYGKPPTAEFIELQRTRSFCRSRQASASTRQAFVPTRVDAEAPPSVKLPSASHVALERVKSFSRGANVPRPWAPRGPSGPRDLV